MLPLLKLMQKYSLQQHFEDQEYVAFSLLSEAVAVQERKHMPLVGASVDRRALQSVGEVFNKNHLSVMICIICGCKHVDYSGYDLFGRATNKGKIHQCCDSETLKICSQKMQMGNQIHLCHCLLFSISTERLWPLILFCRIILQNGYGKCIDPESFCFVVQKTSSYPARANILTLTFAYIAKYLCATNP